MPEYGPHVHNVYDLPHDSELVYHGPQEKKTVTEPSREIPVLREADVVVVGGGPGGCAAAVTAARNGAKTILVERYGHLGGMATGGLVNIIPNDHGVDAPDLPQGVGMLFQQGGDVGEGAQGDEGDGFLRGQQGGVHGLDPVLGVQLVVVLRDHVIADAALAVDAGGVHRLPGQGAGAAPRDGDIPPVFLRQEQGVGGGEADADVARHGAEQPDIQLRAAEGHFQGQGVVHAGVRIDDDGGSFDHASRLLFDVIIAKRPRSCQRRQGCGQRRASPLRRR